MSALAARLARAKEDSAVAEAELEEAIRSIVELPRHEKVAVSTLVEAAIARVRVVRAELAVAEALVLSGQKT